MIAADCPPEPGFVQVEMVQQFDQSGRVVPACLYTRPGAPAFSVPLFREKPQIRHELNITESGFVFVDHTPQIPRKYIWWRSQ